MQHRLRIGVDGFVSVLSQPGADGDVGIALVGHVEGRLHGSDHDGCRELGIASDHRDLERSIAVSSFLEHRSSSLACPEKPGFAE